MVADQLGTRRVKLRLAVLLGAIIFLKRVRITARRRQESAVAETVDYPTVRRSHLKLASSHGRRAALARSRLKQWPLDDGCLALPITRNG